MKKLISLTLALALLLSPAASAYGESTVPDQSETASTDTSETASTDTSKTASTDTSETAGTEESSAAMKKTVKPYGEPWLTSIVDGMVTADLEKPDLKDDFYLNNNYDWLRDTRLKPDHAKAGTFDDLSDLVDERLNALFTDESITGREADLVREFYQMFLDWESRAEGWNFFLEHLKPIQEIQTLEDLTAYLSSEESMYYGSDLGAPALGNHLEHPDEWMVAFGWTTLSMMDSGEYTKRTPAGENRANYHDAMAAYVFQHAGYSKAEAEELIRQNFEFESLIAPWIMTDQEQFQADATRKMYNILSREELEAASPHFPITAILDCYGLNPALEINLSMPAWLERMNELYTEENVPLMRAYLMFQMAGFFTMQFVDEDSYRAWQKLSMDYEGIQEAEADEDAAQGETQTYLSQFVDDMYVQKYTSDKTREDVLELIREVIAVYREMLQEETWLTEETREAAIRKLDAMTLNAVYPDARDDWSGYTFRSRSEGGNLLEAKAELRRCQLELQRRKSYDKPDPKVWSFGTTHEINASYRNLDNSINIYAGILGGDFYREGMTREELLAGAGMVIAHEISHAFDPEGSQHDETGALRNWWTDADRTAFESRAAKVNAYYDSLHPWKDGSPYSGANVHAEAIADMGGLACILRIAQQEKDFDYDAFFRTYARIRRRKMTEITVETTFRSSDPHPMDHLRVNALLAQFPEFQETYGIQPGDGMYVAPEDRITIWGT